MVNRLNYWNIERNNTAFSPEERSELTNIIQKKSIAFIAEIPNTKELTFVTSASGDTTSVSQQETLDQYIAGRGDQSNIFSFGHTHIEFWNKAILNNTPYSRQNSYDAMKHYMVPTVPDEPKMGYPEKLNDYINPLKVDMPLIIASPVGITINKSFRSLSSYNKDTSEKFRGFYYSSFKK